MSTDKVEVPFFTDKAGQIVKRGDYIAYGQALGRSASLNFGKVINIKSGPGHYKGVAWAITIVGLDEDIVWSEAKQKHEYRTVAMNKKSNLQFPDRIVRFDNIPQNFKELLDVASSS